MSHYYFHIRTGGVLVKDEEGMECRDLRAVQVEAQASARDVARGALYSPNIEPTSIQIEDEDGKVLGEIPSAITRH